MEQRLFGGRRAQVVGSEPPGFGPGRPLGGVRETQEPGKSREPRRQPGVDPALHGFQAQGLLEDVVVAALAHQQILAEKRAGHGFQVVDVELEHNHVRSQARAFFPVVGQLVEEVVEGHARVDDLHVEAGQAAGQERLQLGRVGRGGGDADAVGEGVAQAQDAKRTRLAPGGDGTGPAKSLVIGRDPVRQAGDFPVRDAQPGLQVAKHVVIPPGFHAALGPPAG